MSRITAEAKNDLVVVECGCKTDYPERGSCTSCARGGDPEVRERLLEELKLVCIGAFVRDYYMGV